MELLVHVFGAVIAAKLSSGYNKSDVKYSEISLDD